MFHIKIAYHSVEWDNLIIIIINSYTNVQINFIVWKTRRVKNFQNSNHYNQNNLLNCHIKKLANKLIKLSNS